MYKIVIYRDGKQVLETSGTNFVSYSNSDKFEDLVCSDDKTAMALFQLLAKKLGIMLTPAEGSDTMPDGQEDEEQHEPLYSEEDLRYIKIKVSEMRKDEH